MQNLIKRQFEYINVTKKHTQIHEILQFFCTNKENKKKKD